jgi:hypothetical protein
VFMSKMEIGVPDDQIGAPAKHAPAVVVQQQSGHPPPVPPKWRAPELRTQGGLPHAHGSRLCHYARTLITPTCGRPCCVVVVSVHGQA